MEKSKGIVTQIFDSETGIITDNNKIEYYYSKVNFDEEFTVDIGTKVLFEYTIIETEKGYKIYKAYSIEKDNE